MAAAGLADAASLLGDRPPPGYDGPAFERVLALENLDADEVPYYADLLAGGRGSRWVGVASATGAAGCPVQPLRMATGDLPDPSASLCDGWGPGQLAAHLTARFDRRLHPAELRDVGRGAWIVCDRDLDRVAAAVEGLPPGDVDEILKGARAEAARTAVIAPQ